MEAGVTSKTGFHTRVPSGAMRCPAMLQSSAASRSSMGMEWPSAQSASTVPLGATTITFTPNARAQAAKVSVPILLAVSPLAATRSAPTMTQSSAPEAIS